MEFNQQTTFLNKNSIKWMPLVWQRDGDKIKRKLPAPINLKCYKRLNKKNQVCYTPNYTEFKTIEDGVLQQRQSFMEMMDIDALGVDTYDVFQIDVDTPHINQEFLKNLLENTPYHKSLTKSYGYHIFIKVIDWTPPKARLQFKKSFIDPDGDKIDIVTDENGDVELLCGQWGYLNASQRIENADKPILEVTEEDITRLLQLPSTKNTKEQAHTVEVKTNNTVSSHHEETFHPDEITEHTQNIAQKFIDTHDDCFKIVVVLLKYGYTTLAEKTLFRSSNTKNKNLHHVFEDWKQAPNNMLNISTLFYYSKISNAQKFNTILRKYRSICLPKKHRNELFELRTITKTLHTRYLPRDLFTTTLTNEPQIISVKSHLGTGKTTVIKCFLKANPNLRVLYTAPRVAFAENIYGDLKECGFTLYTDLRKLKKGEPLPSKIIIQTESLHRVMGETYDIIVADEIESVLKQLTSKDTNKRITDTYKVFQQIISSTKHIVLLDAFLTEHSIRTIQNIKPNVVTHSIVNTFQPYERKAFELKDLPTLVEQASHQVYRKRERIVIITLSKTDGDFINTYFQKTDKDGFKPNVKYYYGRMNQNDKNFQNVESEWSNVDVLIYTPIITCGVNYDPPVPTFHTLYVWATPGSAVARDLFQSTLRVRKLIHNTCYFAVSRRNYHYQHRMTDMNEIGYDNIKHALTQQQHIIAQLGFNIDTIYEWGLNNMAFKLNEEAVCKKYLLEMIYEYFMLCGYEIIPFQDKPKFYKQEKAGEFDPGEYEDIKELYPIDYVYFQRNPYNLTEQNKLEMKKYEFLQVFDMDKVKNVKIGDKNIDDKTAQQSFWNFTQYGKRMDNMLCELHESMDDFYRRVEETNEHRFDVFMDMDFLKKQSLQRVLNVLNVKHSWDLQYDGTQIDDKLTELTAILTEDRNLWKFRKAQGSNVKTWINGCIKCMVKDWLGCEVMRKRVSIQNTKTYKYDVKLCEAMKDLFMNAQRDD